MCFIISLPNGAWRVLQEDKPLQVLADAEACPELYDRAFSAGVSGGKKRVGLRLLIQRLGR